MADNPQDGYQGQKELNTNNNEFNQMQFLVKMLLNRVNVATLVQVQAVYPGAGSPDECGTVDVLPLIGMVDGAGTIWPQTTVFGLPYFRLQGGAAAVVLDPVVGDIGLVVFCDKDISSAKATFAQAGPPTARKFDMADGFYLGGWMPNIEPTTFVQILPGGTINITTPANSVVLTPSAVTATMGGDSIVLTGSGITLNGNTTINGTLSTSSTISAGGEVSYGSHTLTQHTHTTVSGLGTPTKPVN